MYIYVHVISNVIMLISEKQNQTTPLSSHSDYITHKHIIY